MVAIQNSAYTLTPETTLRDIIKTIPPEYFEKRPLRAWLGVLFSVTAAALGYASIIFAPWYLLPFAWILTGVLILTIFVNFVYTFVNITSSVLNNLKKKIKSIKRSAMKYLE